MHTPTPEQAAIIKIIGLSLRSRKRKQTYFAYVDAEDYKRLKKYAWTARITFKGPKRVDAIRREYVDGVKKLIFMHNEVLQREPGGRFQVDHINRNPLDNRKKNLRLVTPSQNAINTDRAENAKGYFYHKGIKRFICRWRGKYLGTRIYEESAIKLVQEAKNVRTDR